MYLCTHVSIVIMKFIIIESLQLKFKLNQEKLLSNRWRCLESFSSDSIYFYFLNNVYKEIYVLYIYLQDFRPHSL